MGGGFGYNVIVSLGAVYVFLFGHGFGGCRCVIYVGMVVIKLFIQFKITRRVKQCGK